MTLSKCACGTLLNSPQPLRAARTSSYLRYHFTSCGLGKSFLTSKPARQHLLRCHASEPQDPVEDASYKNLYNIPPLIVQVDATRKRTDNWAAVLAVVSILIWGFRWHAQIAGWFSLNLHKLDIPGCLGILTTVATAAVYCKDRFALFLGRQQRRLACVDVIPDLASDVSTLKQDVANIKTDISTLKQDVTDIKTDVKVIKDMIASRAWFRF